MSLKRQGIMCPRLFPLEISPSLPTWWPSEEDDEAVGRKEHQFLSNSFSAQEHLPWDFTGVSGKLLLIKTLRIWGLFVKAASLS